MRMFLHYACVILSIIALAISIAVGAHFLYFRWYLKKDVLTLAHVLNGIALKQQFHKCNSIKLINGKSQTNRYQKSNLLFLQ